MLGICSSSISLGLIDAMNQDIDALYKSADQIRSSKIIDINPSFLSLTSAQTIADVLTERFNRRIEIFINPPPKIALVLWES